MWKRGASLVLALFAALDVSAGMLAEIRHEVRTEFGVYRPYPVEVVPQVKPYVVEPDFSNVANLGKFSFGEEEKALLLKNGFFASPSNYKQMYDIYKELMERQVPIFVTTDCVLHTFHVLYDNILRLLEVGRFCSDLDALNEAMLEQMEKMYNQTEDPKVKEVLRRDVAYLSVATKLLDPDTPVPEYVRDLVEAELALIDAHRGFESSPIFGYMEDYSQYKPRGHYTRNEVLRRYFKAMMWYGRMMFRLEPLPREGGIEKGKEETLGAIYIVLALDRTEVEGRPALEVWDEIYTPTVFFVGRADDLTVQEYLELIRKVYGPGYRNLPLEGFAEDGKLSQFIEEAKKLRDPAICSSWVWEWEEFEDVTKGFRFMGQRYIPDSHIFTELVYSKVRGRLFPMGLDVLSVLGSERAAAILDSVYHQGELYPEYPAKVDSLRQLFRSFDEEVWAQNLYWNWLYCLMPLLFPKGEGYPSFMQNPAWADKELITALGSWAELRHDTILYAKQSYTVGASGFPPGLVHGYVEPNPHLYARLAALARFMRTGLEERGLLIGEVEKKLNSFESLLLKLKLISEKELMNEGLDFEEYELICSIGGRLEDLVTFPPEISGQIESDTDDHMAVVADVHTDPNSGLCLEEGVGCPLNLYVIVEVEGELVVAQGAMFSYFEFKQPMADRLTDEEWQEMLSSGDVPGTPQWAESFAPYGFNLSGEGSHYQSCYDGVVGVKLQVFPEEPTVGEEIVIKAELSYHHPLWKGEMDVTVERPDGEIIPVVMVKQGTVYEGEVSTEGWKPGRVLVRAIWQEKNWPAVRYLSRKALVLAPAPWVEEDPRQVPCGFGLGRNYPNPFNSCTVIPFSLPSPAEVHLAIYDMLGRKVKVLVDGELPAGGHEAAWDGRDKAGREVSSGVYIYRLEGRGRAEVGRMVLLR